MKLRRLLANLGYGSRKEVILMLRNGWVTDPHGRPLGAEDEIDPALVRVDGEPLDPLPGMLIALHKPIGFTCSRRDAGRLVYELLPPRFARRNPALSSVGRLDRDTSGLLLFTDDGSLLHRIIAPRKHLAKVYMVELSEDLSDDVGALFAAGTLKLDGENRPLLPAQLEMLSPRRVRLTLYEGRYHQVRRMFAAVGNHVTALHRSRIGGLDLDALDLAAGAWRVLDAEQQARLWHAPMRAACAQNIEA